MGAAVTESAASGRAGQGTPTGFSVMRWPLREGEEGRGREEDGGGRRTSSRR